MRKKTSRRRIKKKKNLVNKSSQMNKDINEISQRIMLELENASSQDLSKAKYAKKILQLSDLKYTKKIFQK